MIYGMIYIYMIYGIIKQSDIINLEYNRIPGEETSKSDIPPLEAFGLQERVLNSQFYERQAPPRLSPTSSGLPPCGFLYIFSASKNSFLPDRETQPEPSQVSA